MERAWEPHGWYIVEARYAFRSRAALEGAPKGPHAYAHLRLLTKALTEEGAGVGALSLPGWNRDIQAMEVTLLDSSGREVPVDQERVRTAYERQGAIVVPKVGKGGLVAVHIVQGPFASLDAWEHPMGGPKPVWRTSLEFSHPLRLRYAHKAYNGLAPPRRAERRQSAVLTWSAGPIEPLAPLPFLDPASARPRLVLVSRDASAGGYPDWKAVAVRKERTRLGRSVHNRTRRARELARELAGQDTTALGKARALLAWVQENVVRADDAPADQDPDRTLETGRGDPWHLAALLEEMAASVGLDADLVATRDREQGGFDPSLPNPHAAAEPLVVMEAGGRDWAAWPHSRAYGLGDYPPGLFGLSGLSMRTGAPRPLPGPAHAVAVLSEAHTVRVPAEGPPERRVALELEGPYATLARSYWSDGAFTDTLEFCRAFLGALGFPGPFRACAGAGLMDRDRPLALEVVPEEALSSVDSGGARRWTLPSPFSRPAWFYDRARADAYHFPYEQRRRQSLHLEGPPGAVLEAEIPCPEADTSALYVECRRGEDGRPAWTREVLFRKGRYAAEALRAQDGTLRGLDSNVRITLRREAAGP